MTTTAPTTNGKLAHPNRSNYFAEGKYAKTNPQTGVTRTPGGTRLVALSDDFLRGLQRAVADECGPAATTVFYTCGQRWGELFAKRMEKELSDYYGQSLSTFSVPMFEATLVELFSHHGWGRLKFDMSRHHQGLIIATLGNGMVAELFTPEEVSEDALLAGIMAGFFRYLSGQDLMCVQTQFENRGAPNSQFVIGLSSRLSGVGPWVDNGRTHEEILDELSEVRASE